MAFVEGLFCVQTLHLGPVYLAVISQFGLSSGVAVKRGSTVDVHTLELYLNSYRIGGLTI